MNKSKLQENQTAKFWGGRRTPGSGNKRIKSDVIDINCFGNKFRVENKRTDNKSITISTEVINKICREALEMHQLPMIEIQFNSNDLLPIVDNNWCLVERKQLKSMIGEANES